MRVVPLSTASAGMTRLRTKGQAAPNTLYDLLNGYILLSGCIRPRPGTQTDITLPPNTKGLVAHKCRLYVFSHIPQVTSNPDKYVVATLRHPVDPTIPILQIHFAAAFMGFLYVAATFEDNNTWHYWLEELDPWTPNTDYEIGDRVFSTTENGLAYKATRLDSPNEMWAAGEPMQVGDIVEPTVYNGFKYTVVAITGNEPVSGDIEPTWPEKSGAQVIEYAQGIETPTAPVTTQPPTTPPYPIYPGYENPAGGYKPRLIDGAYTVKY